MTAPELVSVLRGLGSAKNRDGQRRFGITPKTEHLGVAIPELRRLAKLYRKNHALAKDLWALGVHEGRILAAFIDDPTLVTRGQMDRWVKDFDSWDLCDQACGNLFDQTEFAIDVAYAWAVKKPEFVRRAGFVMIAEMAVHRKDMADSVFLDFLPVIRMGATDERNFVRKAVNWALRQIGKRNARLRTKAIAEARRIAKIDSKAARWVASDALRELSG